KRCIDLCNICGGETTSFWAGVAGPSVDAAEAWRWLQEGVYEVAEYARGQAGPTREVALEPEPGMLVETIDDWKRLAADMRYGDTLYLALDAGHCLVTQERDPAEAVREMSGWLGTV